MVLKPIVPQSLRKRFENDVEMYGTQTRRGGRYGKAGFENDVEMYGTQTCTLMFNATSSFENDVEMYGTQTAFPKCDY